MQSRVIHWLLPLALLAVAGVGVAMAASTSTRSNSRTVNAANNAKYGTILVGSNGRTLYRYTPDKKGVSTCSGACATNWPPLLTKANAKPSAGAGVSAALLGTIKRSDGTSQVSYAGFALYSFIGDKKPGDVNGEGVGGTWYLVNTKSALVKHPSSSAAATPASTTTSSGGGAWG